MKERLSTEVICMRAAKEFRDGQVVNLGFGIPTLCSAFVPEGMRIIFHSENGVLGFGPPLTADQKDQWDPMLVNASAQFVTWLPGMSLFDHATSFGMVRGGYIDLTILGGLQVSERGDLANWRIPGGTGGMGGAMDLAVGAKRVVITMEHTTKKNEPKILKECTFPLTAKECVNLVITDLAVIEVTKQGLVLKEVAPSWTVDEVQALTEPRLIVAEDLEEIEL
jgi:3-oxoacid CoA-transferase B subunit